jgi:hypothetical protein
MDVNEEISTLDFGPQEGHFDARKASKSTSNDKDHKVLYMLVYEYMNITI